MKHTSLIVIAALAMAFPAFGADSKETLGNFLFQLAESYSQGDGQYQPVFSDYGSLSESDRRVQAAAIAKKAGFWKDTAPPTLAAPLTGEQLLVLAAGFLDWAEGLGTVPPNHPYQTVSQSFEARIKNMSAFPAPVRPFVAKLYARGLLDLDRAGNAIIASVVTTVQSPAWIATLTTDRTGRQEKEIKRYLEVMGQPKPLDLTASQNSYALTLTSQGSELPVKTTITVDQAGRVRWERQDYDNPLPKAATGTLKPEDTAKLFDFIFNHEHFFLLPTDLTPEMVRMDMATNWLAVSYNGRTLTIGGYDAYGNNHFNALATAIERAVKPITDKAR